MGTLGNDAPAVAERLAGLRSAKHDFGILASDGPAPAARASPDKTSRLSGMKFSSERPPSKKFAPTLAAPAAAQGPAAPRLAGARFSSTQSTQSASGAKIKLNRTFLEVHNSDYEPPRRHRASSDPGTERSSEEEAAEKSKTKFWQQEMEKLSEKMNQIWSNKGGSASGEASASASGAAQAPPQQDRLSNLHAASVRPAGEAAMERLTAAVARSGNLTAAKPAGSSAMARLESLRAAGAPGPAASAGPAAVASGRPQILRASTKEQLKEQLKAACNDQNMTGSPEKTARLSGMKFSSERLFSKKCSFAQSAEGASGDRLPGAKFGSERLPGAKFGSAQSASGARLKLNRTFLEVHNADAEVTRRRRSSSDPGTEVSDEAMGENVQSKKFWQHELDNLSEHMRQIWSSKNGSSVGDVSDSGSDFSNTNFWPHGAAGTEATNQHPAGASHDEHMAEVRKQLKIRKLEGKYGDRRRKPLSQALAVIAEIPEQVREFLDQTANSFVSDMEERLSEMRAVIQANEDPDRAQDALDKLDAIPDIMLTSFEESFAHANDMVQIKVDGVLSQIGDGVGKDELAFQASTIPEAVARIAETEFATALQASQQRAAAGIDAALRAAPAAAASQQCMGMFRQVQVQGQQLASAQLQSKAQLTINEAISIAPSVPSAPVATFSPPASRGPSTSFGLSLSPPNVGSFGHPELCPRPCIYFARGVCAHGADCEYCHMDHSKRPSHLDKRNRETLKAAQFEEVLVLSLPLLREKVRKLGLNPDTLQVLGGLEGRLAQTTDFGRIRRTKALQNLGSAMGCLTLRSLLTALQRPNEHVSPEHAVLEAYVNRVRTLIMPNASPGALGDLQSQHEM